MTVFIVFFFSEKFNPKIGLNIMWNG